MNNMSDVKLVKVDNWGIYFLQRLKHFFNRTDYCDLTLQFQDNAQLKVHRLVLNACTEYFELLERTCEMYEDCLVMPDDLQADVVVPIVNFMYTGQLEFKMNILEKLYQTAQIMNIHVLTKLLEAHRKLPKPALSYSHPNKSLLKKRTYNKAFEPNSSIFKEQKVYKPMTKSNSYDHGNSHQTPEKFIMVSSLDTQSQMRTSVVGDPRPTRYEVPEELDSDNLFDNFSNISYTSKPLIVHPETVKYYPAKKPKLFTDVSGSKKICLSEMSTLDILDCPRSSADIFGDNERENSVDESDMFSSSYLNNENNSPKDSSKLFDQILDQNEGTKVIIEAKDNKAASNLDHAKIISEVLKKYPHLMKSNKNIKLKILDAPSKLKKQLATTKPKLQAVGEQPLKIKSETGGEVSYTDVLDSKQAAKLIALGAENIKGPWICLICGTPGKALNFSTYFKFRQHLVNVHKEKPVVSICEYCGLKSYKRNYMLHHQYTKHNVPPPPPHHFPKCNQCSYIAINEGLLIKHKMSHTEIKNFRCHVCNAAFTSSNSLLLHIKSTGHKYTSERKKNSQIQCPYCLKIFMREMNFYTHLKTYHRKQAKADRIIDESDDEIMPQNTRVNIVNIKNEPKVESEYEELDVQYEIKSDGNIVLSNKKQSMSTSHKQTILNNSFDSSSPIKQKPQETVKSTKCEVFQEYPATNDPEEIFVIDNNEYILKNDRLVPRNMKPENQEYILSTIMDTDNEESGVETVTPTTSLDYGTVQSKSQEQSVQHQTMMINKPSNLNQQIQIVVSNEEEYKALMSSNHPIIFGNDDQNKTLTVLPVSHNSTIQNQGLDLNNTPVSSDMMIIQDDYPLNVSQSVPTNNSNIVVVYGTHVSDENKQYQILSTQGLGAQFVQSSTIITQNFDSVTTSTPVMSANILDTPEVWHNHVENQVHVPTTESEVQVLSQIEQAHMVPGQESMDNFAHLPEVQLVSNNPNTAPILVQQNNLHSSIAVLEQGKTAIQTENNMVDMSKTILSHHINTTEQSDNTSSEHVSNDQVTFIEEIPTDDHIVNESNNSDNTVSHNVTDDNSPEVPQAMNATQSIEVCNEMEVSQDMEITHEQNMNHHKSMEGSTCNEERTIQSPSPTFTQNQQIETSPTFTQKDIPEPVQSQEVSNPTEPVSVVVEQVIDEKIENLTSEWSEDEYDSVTNTEKQDTNNVIAQPLTPAPLEESIENIQQEVQKHTALRSDGDDTADSATSSQEDNIACLTNMEQPIETNSQLSKTVTVVPQPAQISSLLNDWEDNDSQDHPEPSEGEENVTIPSKTSDDEVHVTQEPEQNNKIKSLVSDWDDDDEIKE